MVGSRIPPIPLLRAFEAVSRHLSFTSAASELNVTQTAVSHQIRALEDRLGVRLFDRNRRKVELTKRGVRLLPAVQGALLALERAIDELDVAHPKLSVTTTPSFGARWLAPRLARFMQDQPGLELTIRHSTQRLDLNHHQLDVAIRWGGGNWPDGDGELLVDAPLVMVCRREYAEELDLHAPRDMCRATLLVEDRVMRSWLAKAGLQPAEAKSVIAFDDENAMIQAIIDNQGIGFAPFCIVSGVMSAGDVVMPFGEAIVHRGGYRIIANPRSRADSEILAFKRFLAREMGRDLSEDRTRDVPQRPSERRT